MFVSTHITPSDEEAGSSSGATQLQLQPQQYSIHLHPKNSQSDAPDNPLNQQPINEYKTTGPTTDDDNTEDPAIIQYDEIEIESERPESEQVRLESHTDSDGRALKRRRVNEDVDCENRNYNDGNGDREL